jgi:mycothiol system anti-sigma-R factor
MKCDLVDRRVGAFVDGELDPASMLDVERHVEACGRCQEIIGFERRFRSLVNDSLSGVEVPDALRSRVSRDLDAVDVRGETAILRRRSLQVFVAAASLTLIVGVAHQSRNAQLMPLVAGGVERIPVVTPAFDDALRLHASALPADVRAQAPSEVSQFFSDKVSFPVTPAAFDGGEARLTGARLQPLGARTAAALHYDVGGRRVTVFVTDGEVPELGAPVPEGEVVFRNVGGQMVPVRRHGNLTYVFTGDVERETLARLARTARVSH